VIIKKNLAAYKLVFLARYLPLVSIGCENPIYKPQGSGKLKNTKEGIKCLNEFYYIY